MKKILQILCILCMITGCSTTTSTTVTEIEAEYIDIEEQKYNTDEPLKNLKFTQEILRNGYSIIELTNDSNNCYADIEYSINGQTGHFEYVAGNSTVYDYIATDVEDEIQIVDYTLSIVPFFDASDYVSVKRVFDTTNHTLGTLDFENINYRIYTKYFVLYNHYFIGTCHMMQDFIPDYNEIEDYKLQNNSGNELEQLYSVDFMTLYMDIDSDGYLIFEGTDEKVEYHELGRCELYPEYVNMSQTDFRQQKKS